VKEEINSFLNYLTVEKGFSVNTLDAYRNDLQQLASFAGEEAAKQGLISSWENFSRHRRRRGHRNSRVPLFLLFRLEYFATPWFLRHIDSPLSG